MKTLLLPLFIAVASCSSLGSPPPQHASSPPERVGYVDLQKVAADSEVGKRGTAELTAFQQAKVAEINQVEAVAKKAETDKASDAKAKRAQVEQASQRANAEFNQRQQAAEAHLLGRIRVAVAAVAAERKLSTVLAGAPVFIAPGLDVTGDVIARLDGKGSVESELASLRAKVQQLEGKPKK